MDEKVVADQEKDPSQLIRWPAVGLIFAGTCDLLFKLRVLVGGEQFGEALSKAIKELGWTALESLDFSNFGAPANLILTILGLLISVLVMLGGIAMLRKRIWALGLVAAILAMIPCHGTCCGLSLPIGIWALVVLMKPEVKQAIS